MAGPNCMLNCNKNKKLPRPHNEKNKEHMYVCMQQRKPEQARGEVYPTGRYPQKKKADILVHNVCLCINESASLPISSTPHKLTMQGINI